MSDAHDDQIRADRRPLIVYEDPLAPDGDGIGTAWCHGCGRGLGYLSEDALVIYRWARAHNSSEHGGSLSVRLSGGAHGGRKSDPARDVIIAALSSDGLSSRAIAAQVGMSASGVRSALRRAAR